MRRILGVAVVAALVAASATQAQAQDDMVVRRASLFDLGIYAGGAWTSSWFEIDDEGFQVGLSPIFGATATYWASPSFGVRLHGAYFPSSLPEADTDVDGNENMPMNNYLYDLDLVFRPMFFSAGSPLMSSLYLFLGGGGLTTNVAGEGKTAAGTFICVPDYAPAGVCLSRDPEYASVGQGVVGLGFDLFPISSGLGIFGELAVHGYDSPAHVFNEQRSADKFAFTPRAVLGLKFMFGDILPPPPVVVPPVAPPPPPPPPVVETPATQTIRVCVIEGMELREVEATYDPATGDTTVAGQPFATAFPGTTGYAAGATWYINNEPITIGGRRYVKFGLPRVVGVTEVRRTGEYQGVGVFTEATATGTPDVIYIPVRPGCEFQPYQYEVPARGVRG